MVPKKSDEKKLRLLEEKTRRRVSRTLTSTEVTIAKWNFTKKKPKTFSKKIEHIKKCNRLLTSWLRKSLKGPRETTAIVKRLEEFTKICKVLRWQGG